MKKPKERQGKNTKEKTRQLTHNRNQIVEHKGWKAKEHTQIIEINGMTSTYRKQGREIKGVKAKNIKGTIGSKI